MGHTGGAKGLLLALFSGVTPGGSWGITKDVRIEPGLTMCKSSVLPQGKRSTVSAPSTYQIVFKIALL